MKFEELLATVGDEPMFETGLLMAGNVDVPDLQRQLARWTRTGRIQQLRRGLYLLAPPFARRKPHAFLVANRLVRGSYVSLQSALSYHGLIPEGVPVVTSVGSVRPGRWLTPLGTYEYRHLKRSLVDGYESVAVGEGQTAFVGTPEKALFDLIHLEPGGDRKSFIESLRLQSLGSILLGRLRQWVTCWRSPKMTRAARILEALIHQEREEIREL